MEHSPVVARYLDHSGRAARPGREEEREIARRAHGNDAAAVGRLVQAHIPFVVHVAKEFRGRGVPFEDLVGEGCLGLLRALSRYDTTSAARFVTYAGFWVRKAILQAVSDQPRTVRVPRYARERGEATPRETRLDAEAAGREGIALADLLPDRSRPPTVESMIAREERERLRRGVLSLSARERAVLASRYGLLGDPALTLKEAGARLGISRERVRQIEIAALARLRKALSGQGVPRGGVPDLRGTARRSAAPHRSSVSPSCPPRRGGSSP